MGKDYSWLRLSVNTWLARTSCDGNVLRRGEGPANDAVNTQNCSQEQIGAPSYSYNVPEEQKQGEVSGPQSKHWHIMFPRNTMRMIQLHYNVPEEQ